MLQAKGIRIYLDDLFMAQAQALRNSLMRWRLENWESEFEMREDLMDMSLSARMNQVTMPIKALAKDGISCAVLHSAVRSRQKPPSKVSWY